MQQVSNESREPEHDDNDDGYNDDDDDSCNGAEDDRGRAMNCAIDREQQMKSKEKSYIPTVVCKLRETLTEENMAKWRVNTELSVNIKH